MIVIGINGSPRKKWNTATLLTKGLEGSASQGAETELVHLKRRLIYMKAKEFDKMFDENV